MTRDSLCRVLAVAVIGGGSMSNAVAAENRYGSGRDLGYEVYSLQQALNATNAKVQQMEREVADLRKQLGSGSRSSAPPRKDGSQPVSHQPSNQPAGGGFVHNVERGETLSSISRRYGVGVDRIIGANRIADPHRLRIGQEIFIPSSGSTPVAKNTPAPQPQSSSSQPTPPRAAPANQSGGVHIVRPGDTLSRIARTHGTSVNELMRTNGIHNPNALQIGDEIRVPGSGNSGSSYAGSPSSGQKKSSGSSGSSSLYDNGSSSSSSSGEVEAPEGYGWYQVERGDTLHSIALSFSTTTRELRRLNDLNSDELRINQYLLVPVSDASLYES